MNLKVLEDEKDKLKIEVQGETATLTQLISTQVWKEGGDAAALKEHPFMEEAKILVLGSNPRKLLEKAATALQEQCDELKEGFQRALKK
jgi:DNA-directed RNA polymerase subunit L